MSGKQVETNFWCWLEPGADKVGTSPVYHHGAYVMPATARFLYGFIAGIRRTLDGKSQKSH
ncbi:hypothetical protein [Thalassospira australica]|uniref:hypothetical protein n=1 Tax=Thalassospira australica TaxID=1528106 RepID=UPI000519F422|nr:hypothetical protein [Thalassospira australica]